MRNIAFLICKLKENNTIINTIGLVIFGILIFGGCQSNGAPSDDVVTIPDEIYLIDEADDLEFDYDEEAIDDEFYQFTDQSEWLTLFDFGLIADLTSESMREFETRHAVSQSQERYLAFGAFVPTVNRESSRILALQAFEFQAIELLSNFWSITDRAGALVQLSSLSTANGQSPIANEIFHRFVKNGQLELLDLFDEIDITGLENVYAVSARRAERMVNEFIEAGDLEDEYFDEAVDILTYMFLVERINSGLEAYLGAKAILIEFFGFTESELLAIPSLAAWDYGRTTIIARYGVLAGYLDEDEAWYYLHQAANNAAATYSCWREYTAAHILGRALAFGNDSTDMIGTLNFLLNDNESPFNRIQFNGR